MNVLTIGLVKTVGCTACAAVGLRRCREKFRLPAVPARTSELLAGGRPTRKPLVC
jgi:hypothetical protein